MSQRESFNTIDDFLDVRPFDRDHLVPKSGTRLVHYTTADVLISIIRTKSLWLRNTNTMNDFQEIRKGVSDIMISLENSDALRDALLTIDENIFLETRHEFKLKVRDLLSSTYVFSLSKHCDLEDDAGRLSMWRAYGGGAGIAMVLKTDGMWIDPAPAGLRLLRVHYIGLCELKQHLSDLADRIRAERNAVAEFGSAELKKFLLNRYILIAATLKHSGFAEEAEWRVVHNGMYGVPNFMTEEVQSVRGIPQVIKRLHIGGADSNPKSIVNISDIIDRIIIGPTNDPLIIKQAIIFELNRAGMGHLTKSIAVSQIPLRC